MRYEAAWKDSQLDSRVAFVEKHAALWEMHRCRCMGTLQQLP